MRDYGRNRNDGSSSPGGLGQRHGGWSAAHLPLSCGCAKAIATFKFFPDCKTSKG